jgi:prepilin-type N-terminal cleavage/methylation domain-containing protein
MSKGVTLLELMAVLVILSIMAAIALPSLSGLASRKSLHRQGDELAALLCRAREKAMEQGISWRFFFHPKEDNCSCFGDVNANSQLDPGEEQLGSFHLQNGITYGSHASSGPNNTKIPTDGVSFVNNRIRFSPMGSCNSGTVYLKSADRSIALRLLPSSGTVRMWEYTNSWQELK